MQMTIDRLLKIAGIAFIVGSTVAAMQAQISNKADAAAVQRDSIVLHTQLEFLQDNLNRGLTDLTYEIRRANERLKEICLKTKAGCQ
jgi:hypothetical protein